MLSDPHIVARLRERRNRLRAEGAWGVLRELSLITLAVGVLVPLVRPTFLSFLDRDPAGIPEGVHQLVLRFGMVVVGWLAIDVYGVLVRAPRRDLLAILPVDPAAVVRAELLSLAVARTWLVLALAALMLPIALHGEVHLWARAAAALASCWVLGITASAVAHLLAIGVAESPRWVPVLDLLRGQNPRASAAFLYAPGVVLAGSGLFIGLASAAVAQTGPLSWLALASPALVGLVLIAPIPALARAHWFRGSAVLADIDGRYAASVELDRDEARRVYLEWAVRFLPASWRRYAQDDLRHGWRTRRTLVTGAWLLGFGALAAGWTDPAPGALRGVVVVVAGVFAVAANGVLMSRDEPVFLRATLPRTGPSALAGRAAVLVAWALPIVALGGLGAVARHGTDELARVLLAGAVALVAAVVLSIGVSRLREPAIALYGPLAAVAGGLLVVGIT